MWGRGVGEFAFLIWDCAEKEGSGSGVCHLVPREGSVAGCPQSRRRCPHYAVMRESGALGEDDKDKNRGSV